jgi:MoxR-like ATPase
VISARRSLADVRVSDELKRYIVELAAATRRAPAVRLGASPRASLALMKLAQALAAFDGMDFVTPDHIQEIAVEALAHRLVLDPQRRFAGDTAQQVVADILRDMHAPH